MSGIYKTLSTPVAAVSQQLIWPYSTNRCNLPLMAKTDDDDPYAFRDIVQPWEKNFREQMVLLRKSKGINQTQLAKRLSSAHHLPFHQQTVQRIEAGDRPVRLNEAVLIARELGSSITTMMAAAPPDTRKAMHAVDDLREVVTRVELGMDCEELSRAEIPAVLFDLIGDEDPPEELDATALYLLRWAVELADVARFLNQAEQLAAQISRGLPAASLYKLPDQYEWIHKIRDKYAEQLDTIPRFPEAPNDSET